MMNEKRDPFDGEYIGRIFSNKTILYGGLLILFFTALAVYRHWALDVPFGMEESAPLPTDAMNPDSILLRK